MCPNKFGATVKDTENKSHTVLARSLLSSFYNKDVLLGKNFRELDEDIIEACVAMLILKNNDDCIFENNYTFKITQK